LYSGSNTQCCGTGIAGIGTFSLRETGTGKECNSETVRVPDPTENGKKMTTFWGNNAASHIKKARFCTNLFI
jgi:hypothetical protein